MIEYSPDWLNGFLWAVILGFILAFLVAFGMGANDCANSYGTVVGSGVLNLWQAYILATIFESLGALLLGYKVTDTMRKSIVDVSIYEVYSAPGVNGTYVCMNKTICSNSTNCTTYTSADFIIGEIGCLTGTGFWLLLATIFQFPVSATHSAVGATVGFSLVLKGAKGINWFTIANIVISWVASPLLAGAISVLFYLTIKFTCLKRDDQFESSLKMLPFFFLFTLTVNIFSILYDGSKYLKFDQLSWWACLIISLAVGLSTAAFMWSVGVKLIRTRALTSVIMLTEQAEDKAERKGYAEINIFKATGVKTESEENSNFDDSVHTMNGGTDSGVGATPSYLSPSNTVYPSTITISVGNTDGSSAPATPAKVVRENAATVDANRLADKLRDLKRPVEEQPLAMSVFTYLQLLSACFLSFSHGSNDTANAVGALVGLWATYKTGSAVGDDGTLQYIILLGAGGMIIGLWLLGHKVIKMIGTKIVHVTPPSGFAMEIGTAFTVLAASKIGIPVSTTHCAVGAIVGVGWLKSHKGGVSWSTFRNIALAWIITLPVAGAVSALVAYLFHRFLIIA